MKTPQDWYIHLEALRERKRIRPFGWGFRRLLGVWTVDNYPLKPRREFGPYSSYEEAKTAATELNNRFIARGDIYYD